MAQTLRYSVQDFMSAVRSAGSFVGKYTAALNSAGNVKITLTSTGALVSTVTWNGASTGAANDANISGDTVIVHDGNGGRVNCDAQQFLNTLT